MKLIHFVLAILFLPSALAIGICEDKVEPPDIPCLVVSTWNYTNCTQETAYIYNNSGVNIQNSTFAEHGNSTLCQFTWNLTQEGSYSFLVTNQDSGGIIVQVNNLMLATIVGIGIVTFALLFLAFKIDEQHEFLRVLLIFSAIVMLTFIPLSTFLPDATGETFYRFYLFVFRAFWVYVVVYIIYFFVSRYMGRRTTG